MLIKTLKALKFFIRKDMLATSRGDFFKEFTFCPVFRFIVLLRFNEYLLNSKKILLLRVFFIFWYRRLGVRLGFSIPLNVFDYGLGIVHSWISLL